MKIISHNMKPEELRSFDIYSTDDSGLFDSVPYMHSVESTKQEQEEADSEDYDSFDEWLYFVSGSEDFIHFADEDEEVEFVVLPKDKLIMYMWLDGGPSTSKIERVLKDFVGGKMVEVPAKPGWIEGAVRNFPPFNDDEHKTYVCMNGKYYTYPSELEKKGVEESRRPSRRGRMLKEDFRLVGPELRSIQVSFAGTGMEPVDDIVELGDLTRNIFSIQYLCNTLFDVSLNSDYTFTAKVIGSEVKISVFDENEDKVGDLYFETCKRTPIPNPNEVEVKMNNILKEGY